LIDVASEAGVSRVAAGHVLLGSGQDSVRVSADTTERILEAAQKLGYQPNRSAQRLSGGTGNLIGAIVHSNAPEIERDRLVALERVAWKRGYQLLITSVPPGRPFKRALHAALALANQGAAGIIFLNAGIRLAGREGRPDLPAKAVYCGIPSTIGKAPGVILDLAHGYRLAVRHFVESGRRRIGVLNVQFANRQNRFTACRLDAVQAEAKAVKNLTIHAYHLPIDAGHRTPSAEVAEALVEKIVGDDVDAVLANSDMTALRMIQVLHKRGLRVPDDVAVCGLNNLEASALASPPLTTIDERAGDVATAMLELLLEQIHSPDSESMQRIIQPELVIREST